MNHRFSNALNFIIGILVVVGVCSVMSMSYEDDIQDQQMYCEMVASGAWGDYNQNFNEICK